MDDGSKTNHYRRGALVKPVMHAIKLLRVSAYVICAIYAKCGIFMELVMSFIVTMCRASGHDQEIFKLKELCNLVPFLDSIAALYVL